MGFTTRLYQNIKAMPLPHHQTIPHICCCEDVSFLRFGDPEQHPSHELGFGRLETYETNHLRMSTSQDLCY